MALVEQNINLHVTGDMIEDVLLVFKALLARVIIILNYFYYLSIFNILDILSIY